MDLELNLTTTRSWQHSLKRLIDILGAGVGLLMLGPVLLAISLIIQLETPGRVFYRQTRLGLNGLPFQMLKFQTMHPCAEEMLAKVLHSDAKRSNEYQKYQKLAEDPRLTRVGHFLRRSSLDELPQLWNVLIGEMSLVGPRPILPEQQALYGPSFRFYQAARPGMTGLWQTSGRNHLSFEQRVCLDEKYFKVWSIRLDLKILIRTPYAVLFQGGAY